MVRFLILFSVLLYALSGAKLRQTQQAWHTAELEMLSADEMVAITVQIPAGATVKIVFPHQTDYTYTNSGTALAPRRVKIPWAVFYPNEPLSDTYREITPEITVTTADGVVHAIDCPPFALRFAALEIDFLTPGTMQDGVFTAKADASGSYTLWGMVQSVTGCEAARVSVNGEPVILYEGCIFIANLRVVDDAPTTYTLIAEMDNFQTVTETVTVLPQRSAIRQVLRGFSIESCLSLCYHIYG